MENEDQASALLRFQNGVYGMTEMSRIAFGSKMAPTNVVTALKNRATEYDPDFTKGLQIQRVMDVIVVSALKRKWIAV